MSVPLPSADLSQPGAGDALGEWGPMDVAAPRVHVSDPSTLTTTEAAASESDPPAVPLSDAELLTAFVQRRDADAFTEIVQRYRHLVYRVALRTVVDRHLADDVFQATFLVLAQSAKKIKRSEALAAWLHGTARNIARRAMVNQHAEQKQLKDWAKQTLAQKGEEMATSTDVDPFEELTRRHEQQLLDEELQQLPEASRAPLVLFYLEKKSQAEIAQIMGLSVEAVEGRLKRAKQELRTRLIRRGVLLSTVVAAATVLTPSITSAAPAASLVSATVTTALGTAALGSTALGATAVTGAATSSKLAAGSATATTLAAQEIAIMSATSKATMMLITTAASTTLISGLVLGAMVGTFSMGTGAVSQVSHSSLADNEYPMGSVAEEFAPSPFTVESEAPVLLALADAPTTQESDAPLDERTVVKKYDVSDMEPSLRDKFVIFYGLTKVTSIKDGVMEIRALPEDHWLYEESLANYRKKRDQGKLQETESEAILSTLQGDYALVPTAALDNMQAAEQELADRESTHGPMDLKLAEIRLRVELWRAVYNAVRKPTQPESLDGDSPRRVERNPEINPVVYTMSEMSIDQKWIALEYARSLSAKVESHDTQRAFIVRASNETHSRIKEFMSHLQNADYEKSMECVSQLLSRKLRTHSDNHPALQQLRNLSAQLERVDQEYQESQIQLQNDDEGVFLRHKRLRFFADQKSGPTGDTGSEVKGQSEEQLNSKSPAPKPEVEEDVNRPKAVTYPLEVFGAGNLQEIVEFAESISDSVSFHTGTHSLVIRSTPVNHRKFADYVSQIKGQQETDLKRQFEIIAARKWLAAKVKEFGEDHPEVRKARVKVSKLENAIADQPQVAHSSENVSISTTIFQADDAAMEQLADKDAEGRLIPRLDSEEKLHSLRAKKKVIVIGDHSMICRVGQLNTFFSGGEMPLEPLSKDRGGVRQKVESVESGTQIQLTIFDKKANNSHRVLKYDLQSTLMQSGDNNPKLDGRELPVVIGRVFRGYVPLPEKESEGALIGPLETAHISSAEGTLRKVSTYLWFRQKSLPKILE